MKRFVKILLICILVFMISLLSVLSSAEKSENVSGFTGDDNIEDEITHGYTKYAEQDGTTLYYNSADGILMVKRGNTTWCSTSPLVEEAEFEQGSVRQEMRSLLVVKYVNSNYSYFNANSRVASVNRGTYTVDEKEQGFVVTYDFSRENEKFSIPLQCTLKNGNLYLEILASEIKEYGSSKIIDISIAPYFEATRGEEAPDGFVFVPDGSGAVISLSQKKGWAEPYSKMIYGPDASHSDYAYTQNDTPIYLPVFGMNAVTKGFTAIVEKGEAHCSISAVHPGYRSDFASVGAVYNYRQIDTHNLGGSSAKEELVYLAPYVAKENPVVSYRLVSGDCGIAKMAGIYRDYLEKECGISAMNLEKPSITLELIGSAIKKKAFMGIVTDHIVSATTFDQAGTIIKEVTDGRSFDVNAMMYYFSEGSTKSKVPTQLRFERKLGGSNGREKLTADVGSGVHLFYCADFINISRSSFGCRSWNSAATSILKTKMYNYEYRQSTNSIDKKSKKSFYLKPANMSKYVKKFAENLTLTENEGILLTDMGGRLYSDYGTKNPSHRSETKDIFKASVDVIRNTTAQVSADGANAYLLGRVSLITNVPVSSSNAACLTSSVPFYSIALHGLVNMSGKALNNSTTQEQELLELLTGVCPVYRMTGVHSNLLEGSDLDTIYNSYYKDWIEPAQNTADRFAGIHKNLCTKQIIDYEDTGLLKAAKYEDGTIIVINTSDKEGTYGTVKVPSMAYAVINS